MVSATVIKISKNSAAPMAERRGYLGDTAFICRGSGRPIIFVHGVGMTSDVWTPQLEAFVSDHTVIAYDLLGHGGSALPPESPSLRDFSNQLLAVMNGLRIDATAVIGHSMGALVALEFALDQPERVERVIALNGVFCRSPAQREAVLQRAQRLATGRAVDGQKATIHRWFGDPVPGRHAAMATLVEGLLASVDPIGYARTYDLFARSDGAHANRLQNLAMPALFLTGEFDPNSTPEMSRAMAAKAPFGHAQVIAGERHMMSLTASDIVNAAIRAFVADQAHARAPACVERDR
jgi:(E)-2-((N-methylformamido)methylene)succinate hydrolase